MPTSLRTSSSAASSCGSRADRRTARSRPREVCRPERLRDNDLGIARAPGPSLDRPSARSRSEHGRWIRDIFAQFAGYAFEQGGLEVDRFIGRWRNNRAKNSHQPTRRHERKMQGFKCAGPAQRFLSVHAAVHNTFNVQRHLTSARTHRAFRASAMQTWREVVAAA